MDDQYYTFSSIFFYTNRTALLLNGRNNNLEYGSYAPGAPNVFINDAQLPAYGRAEPGIIWRRKGRNRNGSKVYWDAMR